MVIFIITTISISITLLLIIVLVICPCNSANLVVIRIVATTTQLRAKKCSGQQLDLWFDRSHQHFQQTVTQMLEVCVPSLAGWGRNAAWKMELRGCMGLWR